MNIEQLHLSQCLRIVKIAVSDISRFNNGWSGEQSEFYDLKIYFKTENAASVFSNTSTEDPSSTIYSFLAALF